MVHKEFVIMNMTEIYAMEVYKQRNITKAAKILNISQPALSSALLSLENKLGYTIFNRSTSPLTTTPEGDVYYSFLCNKLILEKKLESEISDIHNKSNVNLSIGAPSAYISACILPCINEFIKNYPYANIKIVEGTIPYLEKEAENGHIDFYISTTSKVSNKFILEKIFDENVFLCSNTIIPTKSNGTPDFSQLTNYTFIMLCKNQPLQHQIDNYLNSVHFHPTHIIEVDQVTSAIQLTNLGCGICFATTSALSSIILKKTLNTLILPDSYFKRSLYIATLSQSYINSAQREFINIILKNGGTLNEKI